VHGAREWTEFKLGACESAQGGSLVRIFQNASDVNVAPESPL